MFSFYARCCLWKRARGCLRAPGEWADPPVRGVRRPGWQVTMGEVGRRAAWLEQVPSWFCFFR
jgi:hypothetical protein